MQFIIEARDRGQPPSATQRLFTLDVTDVNDNPPIFSVSFFYLSQGIGVVIL